jgi:hypothetical protein
MTALKRILFQSVAGNWGAEGRFANQERHRSWQMLATQHRCGFTGGRNNKADHTESCGGVLRTGDCSPC